MIQVDSKKGTQLDEPSCRRRRSLPGVEIVVDGCQGDDVASLVIERTEMEWIGGWCYLFW